MLDDWYFWQERLQAMVLEGTSPWFDNVKTEKVKETRDDLFYQAGLKAAQDLGSSLGKDPEQWLWGKVHQMEFVSPIRRKGFGKAWPAAALTRHPARAKPCTVAFTDSMILSGSPSLLLSEWWLI